MHARTAAKAFPLSGSAYNTAVVSQRPTFYYSFICAYNWPPKVVVIEVNIKANIKGTYGISILIFKQISN